MKLSRFENKQLVPNSEFSQALADRICAEAMKSASVTQIAGLVGIPVRRLYQWLKNGNDGDARFAQFAADFRKAVSIHEKRWLENIEDVASLDDPKAANAKLRANEFLLRNFFRNQYTERATSGTNIENQTNFNVAVLSDEQKKTLHTMLTAVVAGEEGAGEEEVHELLAELPVVDVE